MAIFDNNVVMRIQTSNKSTLAASTKVNKYFITLSRIHLNIGDTGPLTYKMVATRLYTLIPTCAIFIVTEPHKGHVDVHFHILVLPYFREALRKNTYKPELEDLFPEFPGPACNIQGVKNIKATFRYFLKGIHISEVVEFVATNGKRTKTPNIWTNRYKTLKKELNKTPEWATAVKIESILHFRDYDKWKLSSLANTDWSVKKSTPSSHAWLISRRLVPFVKVLEPFMNKLVESTDGKWTNYDQFLVIAVKYQLTSDHMTIFSSVLYAILIRDGYFPLLVKIKGTIIQGSPNTGKTRIFIALMRFFKFPVFFFVGARVNDFTGYHPTDKPIIVFDDIFGTGKKKSKGAKASQTWSKGVLLRLLAHEPIKLDVKYGVPVQVSPTQCFVVTNDEFLFQLSPVEANLKARIKLVCLPEHSQSLWADITSRDIEYLVIYTLNKLLIELGDTESKNNIDYGFNYVVKSLPPVAHLDNPHSPDLYKALPYNKDLHSSSVNNRNSSAMDPSLTVDYIYPKNATKLKALEEKYSSDPYLVQKALDHFQGWDIPLNANEKKQVLEKLEHNLINKENEKNESD